MHFEVMYVIFKPEVILFVIYTFLLFLSMQYIDTDV